MYTPYNMFYPELPKAQVGVQAPPINTPTVTQNTSTVDPIGTIINVGGKPARITGYDANGKPNAKLLAKDDPYFLKGPQKDYTSDYNELETALNDKEVRDALWKEYQKSKSSYKITGKGSSYKNIKDADELVKRFLKTQKAIMMLNANTSEEDFKKLNLDSNKTDRDKILADYGIDETDLAAFQKTFYDLKDVSVDDTVPKNVRTKLDQFNWTGAGPVDKDSQTTANKKGTGNISFIDAIFGDNTSRQIATTKQKTPATVTKTEDGKNTAQQITKGTQGPPGEIPEVGWFPQDVNNLYGALADWTGTKKYMPWMPQADFQYYDPTFYDPSRALANINEQTNIGVQGLNAYGSPQGYTAGYNQMQGKAAEQAANTLADYEKNNVTTANNAAMYNAEVDTKQALYNAQKTGNYYDQTTIANQQFDNSRTLARRNIIQGWNTGFGNNVNRGNINQLNPYEYYVDASGRIRFNKNNVPSNLDDTYKADAQRREEQLAKFLGDTKWSAYDNESKMDIYDRIYPGEVSPGNYRKPKGSNPQQDDMYMRMMQMMMGSGAYPFG